MSDVIIQRIICFAIPLLAIPINIIICKYRINKAFQKATQEIKSNAEIYNGYRCKLCGAHYELNKADKYLLKVNSGIFLPPETYECYDCPKCGCQVIANVRKEGLRIDEQTKADTDEHL